jgi:hypothetical protein
MAATARIDRNDIQLEETVNLVLRVDTNDPAGKPDLSVLNNDFHLLSNSQSSRHMVTNGRTQSWTEWHITLMPKHIGQLHIPAITIGKESTRPIDLRVTQTSKSDQQTQAVFLESELSQQRVYVQQQLLFTVRIFNAVQLDGMSLTPPELDQASIELRYAIFPEQSGELLIPELIFSAEQRTSRQSRYGFSHGTPVRKITQQHNIQVLEQPANTLSQPWLPAQSVSLSESWSSSDKPLEVGESITRTIQLTATGTQPQLLAPINFDDINGAKQYPDQGETESSESNEGIISTRRDSVAIIPTQPGPLILPAIRVHWWNTQTQKLVEAVLPEKTINVIASADTATSTTPVTPPIPTSGNETQTSAATTSQGLIWKALSVCLALGWLTTLLRWRRFKKQHISRSAIAESHKVSSPASEAKAFKQLEQACINNQSQDVRTAMLNWAQLQWPQQALQNLDDVVRAAGDAGFEKEVNNFVQNLYSQSSDHPWQGKTLLTILKKLRKQAAHKKGGHSSKELPPLYQTS